MYCIKMANYEYIYFVYISTCWYSSIIIVVVTFVPFSVPKFVQPKKSSLFSKSLN